MVYSHVGPSGARVLQQETINRILIGAGIAVGAWALGWLCARLILPLIAKAFSRTRTQIDDIALAALRPHVPFWFLLLGVVLGMRHIMGDWVFMGWVDRGAMAMFIVSVTLAIAAVAVGVLAESSRSWGDGHQSTSLLQNAIRIIVIALGLLVVASNLGIAITPIITALGVGSLAVALALQPTLSNLFAGFQITLARKVRVGDYIELETGEKGYVEDIDWRTTEIRELPNNLVVVPNAKLADLIVRNYSLPIDEQSVIVGVGVSYNSNLAHVEKVTIEVARETLKAVEGGVPEFDPFTRYNEFGDSSINFSVILRVKVFADRYLVTHEFVKRLHARYEKEGIEIPFPQRVVTFVNPLELEKGGAGESGDGAKEARVAKKAGGRTDDAKGGDEEE
jgi:small-conductance mechanosensitive channel